nr:hypothetical protein [Dyella sp. ASV24]
MKMPMASADRPMVKDFVEPVGAFDGAKVSGMKNHHIGITRRGRLMVSSVHTG